MATNNAVNNMGQGPVGSMPTIATISGIDMTVSGVTSLFTVPTGKTVMITGVMFRISQEDTITVPPIVGIGTNAGEDNIVTPLTLTGLDASNEFYMISQNGIATSALASGTISLGVDTAATATTMIVDIYLFGYIL